MKVPLFGVVALTFLVAGALIVLSFLPLILRSKYEAIEIAEEVHQAVGTRVSNEISSVLKLRKHSATAASQLLGELWKAGDSTESLLHLLLPVLLGNSDSVRTIRFSSTDGAEEVMMDLNEDSQAQPSGGETFPPGPSMPPGGGSHPPGGSFPPGQLPPPGAPPGGGLPPPPNGRRQSTGAPPRATIQVNFMARNASNIGGCVVREELFVQLFAYDEYRIENRTTAPGPPECNMPPATVNSWYTSPLINNETAVASSPGVNIVGGVEFYIGRTVFTAGTFVGVVAFDFVGDVLTSLLNTTDVGRGGAACLYMPYGAARVFAISWKGEKPYFDADSSSSTGPSSPAVTFKTIDDLQNGNIKEIVNGLDRSILVNDESNIEGYSEEVGRLVVSLVDIANSNIIGMRLRLMIVVDMDQYIGGLTDARNVSIIIAICCALAACILGSLMMRFALSSLAPISTEMYRAARIEGDVIPVDSWTTEIHALQDAYNAMVSQLLRMKAFVPESVMLAPMEDDDEANIRENSQETPQVSKNSNGLSEDESFDEGGFTSGDFNKSSAAFGEESSNGSYGSPLGGSTVVSSFTAPLNTSCSVCSRRATVLYLNLRGFTAITEHMLPSHLQERMAFTVSTIKTIVDGLKGSVDSFHGDRFLIHFNAVTTCPAHQKHAAVALLRIVKALAPVHTMSQQGNTSTTSDASSSCLASKQRETTGFGCFIASGISTGKVLCGNVGSDGMRRFNTIGMPVTQAAILERLCYLYDSIQCLCHPNTVLDAKHTVRFAHVDVVEMPKTGGATSLSLSSSTAAIATTTCALLSTPLEEIVASTTSADNEDNEWLYSMDQAEKANPFAILNNCWSALAEGDLGTAEQHVAQSPEVISLDVNGDNNVNNTNNNCEQQSRRALLNWTRVRVLEALSIAKGQTGRYTSRATERFYASSVLHVVGENNK